MTEPTGSPLRLVDDATLAIGDLAERTGVATATLRIWETRYGFPEPHRRRSGHRRYTETDVDLVKRVVDLRGAGVRLDSAIDRVTSEHAVRGGTRARDPQGSSQVSSGATDDPREAAEGTRATHPPATSHRGSTSSAMPTSSLFAWLRKSQPQAAPQRLTKATLYRLSLAIEEEYCSRARPGWVFGAFQHARYYTAAQSTWEHIAMISAGSFALAQFDDSTLHAARSVVSPELVDLPRQHPMGREWCVVVDVPGAAAALAAWELPGQAGVEDDDRRFETIWTLDPSVVRAAACAAAAIVADLGAPGAGRATAALTDSAVAPVEVGSVSSLFNRMLGQIDGRGT